MTFQEVQALLGQECLHDGQRVKVIKAAQADLVYVSKSPGPMAPYKVRPEDLTPLSA